MQKLICPKGGVTHLTFSPDGEMLAGFGSERKTNFLFCWSRSRDWEMTGLEHKGPVTGLAFHPSGRTLAYAAIGRVWATREAPVREAPVETPSVWRRSFARESSESFTGVLFYPLTGTDEFVPNRVRVPHPEGMPLVPRDWARGLAFSPDGKVMIAGDIDVDGFMQVEARIYHWHFTEEDGVWRVVNPVAAAGRTENGGALLGDSSLGLVGLWGVLVCPVSPGSGLYVPDVRRARAVAVAPARELVAVAESGSLTVYHLRQADPVVKPKHAAGIVCAVAFSPDAQTLAVGHSEKLVTFWEPVTGWLGAERDFGVGPVTALAYAPDGFTLAIAGRNGLVVVDTE